MIILLIFNLDQCQNLLGLTSSFKYVCNGTDINTINYNTRDCSGDPLSIINNTCSKYSEGCTATCNKNDCNGISVLTYNNSDCSGHILRQIHYLSGYCIGGDNSFINGEKYTCNNGQIEHIEYYTFADCTNNNNPKSSDKYDNGICSDYTIYNGCNTTKTTSTTSSPDSRTTTFKLFGTIITVFIISLF